MPQAEAVKPLPERLPASTPLEAEQTQHRDGPKLQLVEANPPAKPMSIVETWTRLLLGLVWFGLTTVGFACIMVFFLPHRPTRIRLGNIYGTWAGKGAVWLTGSQLTISGHAEATAQRPAI